MSSIFRPLSRRAFLKAAAAASAASAAPGTAGTALAASPERIGFSDLSWIVNQAKTYIAGKGGTLDEQGYVDVVEDMWDQFRQGSQHVPLESGLIRKAYSHTTGEKFADNLTRLMSDNKWYLDTQYCCYRCGYLARRLALANPDPNLITEANYTNAWGATKLYIFGLAERSQKMANEDEASIKMQAAGC